MVSVSISPSIRLMSLGYDPEARLSSRWEKHVFTAVAVARSLLLRNWRTEQSPTSQEWHCKMAQVRLQEMRYASRVGLSALPGLTRDQADRNKMPRNRARSANTQEEEKTHATAMGVKTKPTKTQRRAKKKARK
ncbi:hypothetical protein NDU88_004984 [Pleurodeles waltl]|uniref:Uncharacterized protein n=1 Tax=Pleurodeles waltl TaxID=8319 RepID=A0AAV7TTK1_PLEWA|nr:hypothetical protein NDU88_004984 [Pleurodeles waltl]